MFWSDAHVVFLIYCISGLQRLAAVPLHGRCTPTFYRGSVAPAVRMVQRFAGAAGGEYLSFDRTAWLRSVGVVAENQSSEETAPGRSGRIGGRA